MVMICSRTGVALGALAVALSLAASSASAVAERTPRAVSAPPAAGALPAEHGALLKRYCVTCHSDRLKTAGLTLESIGIGDVGPDAATWEKVVRKVRSGTMPPSGMPRPDSATMETFASALEAALDRSAAAHPQIAPLESFHRLNRAEYRNVVRDLLAVDFDAGTLLPADDASYGFDNIATSLRIDSSRMEQYLAAADAISQEAVGGGEPVVSWSAFKVPDDVPQYDHVEGLPLGTRGGILVRYDASRDGEYDIKVDLLCKASGGCDPSAGFEDPHQLEVAVDGTRVQLFTIEPHETASPRLLQVRVPLKAGPRSISAAFLKLPSFQEVEFAVKRHLRPFFLGSNETSLQAQAVYQPYVDGVTISGPYAPTGAGDTPSRRRLFTCRPKANTDVACAGRILRTVARRAYRRPVTDADQQRLMRFFSQGAKDGFERGIQLALKRLLVSPEFLYRIERDRGMGSGVHAISDLELASRLSFFLWSSIPDDELLDVAVRGELKSPAVLGQQVRRMLADGRADAFVANFAGQWLLLRNLDATIPSLPLFPNFDGLLRQSFRRETELFFGSILRENRGVTELLTADYTFLNERLARHYGIPNIYGSQFRRVTLDDERRGGLFGHGSILTVTSRPNRTSPVIRGKWILENILGSPPPDPPANVPPLAERPVSSQGVASMRGRMAQHRANPQCTGCHAMIDPLGFALENFDAIGRWRDVDEHFDPVDPSGTLPGGATFDGLAQFRTAIVRQPALFATTVTSKMYTYALGRAPEYYDMPVIRQIVRQAAPNNFRLADLILGIVKSDPFLKRGSPASVGAPLHAAIDPDRQPTLPGGSR